MSLQLELAANLYIIIAENFQGPDPLRLNLRQDIVIN